MHGPHVDRTLCQNVDDYYFHHVFSPHTSAHTSFRPNIECYRHIITTLEPYGRICHLQSGICDHLVPGWLCMRKIYIIYNLHIIQVVYLRFLSGKHIRHLGLLQNAAEISTPWNLTAVSAALQSGRYDLLLPGCVCGIFYPLSPRDALKHHFTSLKTGLIPLQLKDLNENFYESYILIHGNFSPSLNQLHSLQGENCDSNSRLVVDEDDNGIFQA